MQKGIEIEELNKIMGNEKLGEIMRSKTIDLEKLLCCQSKIRMVVKRKVELSSNMKEIET